MPSTLKASQTGYSGFVTSGKPASESKKSVSYNATQSDQIFSISSTSSSSTTGAIPSAVEIENDGKCPIFIMTGYETYTGDATDGGVEYLHTMIMPGEKFQPPVRGIIATGADTAIVDGTVVDNEAPNSNMYVDSTADVDHATSSTIGSDATHTTLNLEDGHSKFFRVGDLIRLENEICEVTATGTGADLANSTLTITRGAYGSTAATHADDVAVRLPFFNAHHDFDKYSVSQSDSNGRFKCFNLFGKGRSSSGNFGITPGSINLKFYDAGYQSLGLSGITGSTNSGLTASTAYEFDIQVDGGTNFDNLSFTTDSSNVNFGGTNGILSKIQEALDTQFYTSGNLFEKKVSVGIVGGDIRFTSGSRLSTSAIALTAGSSGTAEFFGTGRIPAVGSINSAVAAKLPDDVAYDNVTFNSIPNNVFAYDDGYGNIKGMCNGEVNYETGALTLSGCPQNAEFVFSCMENTAFSGKLNEGTADRENIIKNILVNTPNQKQSGSVILRTF